MYGAGERHDRSVATRGWPVAPESYDPFELRAVTLRRTALMAWSASAGQRRIDAAAAALAGVGLCRYP